MSGLRVIKAVTFVAAWAFMLGCGAAGPPDPKEAARAYGEAAASGDADALYEMLTEEDRRSISRDELRAIVARDRQELGEHAAAVAGPLAKANASARVRFKDGEQATLILEQGRFRVASAGTLPGGARTPDEALEQLRRALARRSYSAILRVLSPATRAAIEGDLRSLVTVLEKSSTLPVQVTGDVANVQTPSGHRVKLRREQGQWYVEDFD